ncbi:M13 family metallopeptidase [Piscinibacter sp. XHJ-5]|uniref:M13 family metallopeptidase n=1 Tax=Piscinibacter sp. XHJ-5 TaxID=3037797 RepID=UPI002453052E|nr:M13 family metallopeptidase [Piscinibacter sp. XHJ-5]
MKLPLFATLALATSLALAADNGALQSGLDRAGFDSGVRAQDDLFRHANGTWIRNTPIPADKPEFGGFIELRDRSDERVRKLVEELSAKDAPAGSVEQKIGSFYRAYMDEAAIDRAGLAPLQPWLAQIDALKTKGELAALLGRLQGLSSTPVEPWVDADAKEPTVNRAQLWQGGLGMPDRDYYLSDNERYAKARTAYREYLQTLLRLGGSADPDGGATAVYALERRLAQAHWTRVDNRDPQKTYNPMAVPALAKAAPGFDWAAFFKAADLPRIDRVVVSQPSYAKSFAATVKSVPLPTWKLYLRAQLLNGSAKLLPKEFRDARFAFRGKALLGLEQEKPRWQDATQALDAALGEAVGQVYVARYFPPENKARMQTLVTNLLAAYDESIDGLTWMGPRTRQFARDKLARYVQKIGYPEVWRDYGKLEIRDGDALGNAVRAGRFEWERVARKAGRPVDRREWLLTPQNVNAYYNPSLNEIVFPAAILEPPFFDAKADDAVNYGAIGAIIGHEISHGFDDTGSQYDGEGMLRNWWTDADRKAFSALGDKLVAQYNQYEPLPGHKLNGKLTLGENIADLSGLQIAYKAYRRSLGGKPAPVIDGLSGDERFYLGWAQAWRSKTRPERALHLLTIDTHSPDEFRANGAAVNSDGFHSTFGTKPGDKMFKPSEERIRIW